MVSDRRYELSSNDRTVPMVMIAVGLIAVVTGFATDPIRAWASLLHNNYYFMLIALCGTFFVAFNYLAGSRMDASVHLL